MTLIEKVARALCRHDQATCWETHTGDAIRAIEAMRNPPEEVIEETKAALDCDLHWHSNCQMCGGAKENWHKIVDHELARE